MPDYRCRIGTPDGAIAERFVSAGSPVAAREQLEADGNTIFDIAPRPSRTAFPGLRRLAAMQIGGAGSSILARRRSKLGQADLLLLNQELAALVNAGLPLLRCIDILRTRRSGSLVGSMLDRVRRRVASGAALSGAFRPEIERVALPELFVTSVEVGEASGDLVTAIRRYSGHLDRSIALQRRVRTALMYPVVLAVVSATVVVILLTVVIPQFADFYASSGAELPVLTRALVALAGFVSGYGLALALVAVAAILVFRRWSRTTTGRLRVDALRLRLPFVGAMVRRYLGVEATRTLATLLRGGAPLVSALRVTADGTHNRAFRAGLLGAAEQVSHGTSLHEALEAHRLLDALGLEMVQVGESTGALEEMLGHVSDTYDDVLDRQVTLAVGMMEPAMLVGMGLLVAGILLSLYLPLFQTVQVVG